MISTFSGSEPGGQPISPDETWANLKDNKTRKYDHLGESKYT